MSAFSYTAVDNAGKSSSGIIEADTARMARAALRHRALFPLQVERVVDAQNSAHSGGLSTLELTELTRQWATLIAAGLTIEQALTAAYEQAPHAKARRIISALRAEVTSGHALSNALEHYAGAFPPIYRAMVRAGEKSGRLADVLLRLADYLENRDALRQKVIQALLYPVLVSLIAAVVVIALMTYVVPQVVDAFRHSRQALPWLTQALIAVSAFLRSAGPWLFIFFIATAIAFMRYWRHDAFRWRVERLLLRVPVLGRLLLGIESARFAQTLAILTGGGVPILTALAAGRDVLSLLPLKNATQTVMTAVEEGGELAAALMRQKVFPPLLTHLVASGEKSGQLPDLLERAARALHNETLARISVWATIFEPLLIVVMGAVVLVIVLAVLLPVIQINQLIR